jgi:hypothetical protein
MGRIKMNTKQGILFIGIACLIICAFVGVTSATTIYVPTDYPTIQQAVDNATAGDTIFAYNGTYYENVVVNNSVILEGEDSTNTFVVGGFYVTANGTTIKNFNISQGYEWDPDGSFKGGSCKAGIYALSSHSTIYNNSIQNITGGTGANWEVRGGGAGGTAAGIYLQSFTNNNIASNTIYSIQGGTGGKGIGDHVRGGSGGVGVGIYSQSSNGNTITSNIVYSIRGGDGGEREGWGYTSGGDAGIGAGIYLQSSIDNKLISNTLSSIQGGIGGTGGTDGSGGNGDIGTGIYLRSSVSNNLTSNTISSIRGGTGGRGGRFGSDGASWTGAGIYLQASTNNNLTSNTISYIQGGLSWTWDIGGIKLIDVNKVGYGIYIDSNSLNNQISTTNTMDGDSIVYYCNQLDKTIENYVLTSNSNPTNFGKIVIINCSGFSVYNNTIANFAGKNGGTGRGYHDRGGTGGIGTGIYLQFSANNSIISNTVYSVKGGIGGTGGYWGSGGAGGIGAGIYLQSSANNNLTSNTFYFIHGGTGGEGGHKDGGGNGCNGIGIYLQSSTNNSITSNTVYSIEGGNGGEKGAYSGGSNGANGAGYGISLQYSSNNMVFFNNFLDNHDSGYSYASTNIWNSTSKVTYIYNGTTYENYTGNHWGDYAGKDSNNDGIGDSPYSINSDKDNYPLIKPFESYIPTGFQKGMSYAAWWHDTYATENSDTSLENLKITGTEWVSLIVTWYQDNVSSTEIDNDSNRTPTGDSLIHAINKIHSLNMSVMLKPTVDLQVQNGNWRGSIYFDSEDEWDAWFSSYERFILHYADLAEKNNVEQFCVGVEYKGTVHREYNWRDIIEKVRERYTGPITYASNWDNYKNINWWDALDFVSIDAYFPLTNKADPTVDELKNGWEKWENEIEEFQESVNKQIIFTEIGYCSRDGTNIKPYDYWTLGSVDLQEQADCYNATFQTFWGKPWLAGIYWWMWDSNPEVGGPSDKSYTTYRKPAESIVKEYYCAEKVSFDTCSPANPYPSIFGNIL